MVEYQLKTEAVTINNHKLTEKLRKKYIVNPPEGMTPDDIRQMSDDDLLDMDYFLHEEVFGGNDDKNGFFIF